MKKKLLVIILLLISQSYSLYSQCISAELSVTWKLGYHIFQKDSLLNIPYLNITYRNNCDNSYYFFKLSPRSEEEPMVVCLPLTNYGDDSTPLKRAMAHDNYANEHFTVEIGGRPWDSIGWWIEGGNINYVRRYPTDHDITCCLYEIYKYIISKRGNNSKGRGYGYFQPSLITSENILTTSLREQFVLLKPGETTTDTYNLIGYKIVEGCFTFIINQKDIKDYVIGYIYDSNTNKNITGEIALPETVGEYFRYSGSFNTNKVTVCFGD